MLDVHATFRREFLPVPALIAGVPPDDQERTDIVADHIQFLCAILHEHHTVEDEFLWPKLKNRGAEEVVGISLLMEGHHSGMARILDQMNSELRAWRGSAGSQHGPALVQTTNQLLPALLDHMSLEESGALPVIERHVTADEWQQMAEAGRKHFSQEELALAIGMITSTRLESAAQMPLSPFEQQSLQVFLRYAERVHGPDSHIGIKRWQER
ncbi:MAG TPA: hemerythrin domain-containing protein [Paraburkholderia sp.]|jgi:hemerythrin-like domain-containing protein